jgi:ribosomal protein L37E
MPNTIVEMKCPRCGRETQYRTGLCEWCGADLFPQHAKPVGPAAPPTPLYQLHQSCVRSGRIAFALWAGAALLLLVIVGTVKLGNPPPWIGADGQEHSYRFALRSIRVYWQGNEPLLAPVALVILGVAAVFNLRSRKTRVCKMCGGIMVLRDVEQVIVPGSNRHGPNIRGRYSYECTACHDVVGEIW